MSSFIGILFRLFRILLATLFFFSIIFYIISVVFFSSVYLIFLFSCILKTPSYSYIFQHQTVKFPSNTNPWIILLTPLFPFIILAFFYIFKFFYVKLKGLLPMEWGCFGTCFWLIGFALPVFSFGAAAAIGWIIIIFKTGSVIFLWIFLDTTFSDMIHYFSNPGFMRSIFWSFYATIYFCLYLWINKVFEEIIDHSVPESQTSGSSPQNIQSTRSVSNRSEGSGTSKEKEGTNVRVVTQDAHNISIYDIGTGNYLGSIPITSSGTIVGQPSVSSSEITVSYREGESRYMNVYGLPHWELKMSIQV